MSDARIDPQVIDAAHRAFWDAYDPPGDSLPLDVKNAAIEAAIREADRERGLGLLNQLAAKTSFTLWSNPHGVGRWCVAVGPKSYWGDTAREALENALAGVSDWRPVEQGGEA